MRITIHLLQRSCTAPVEEAEYIDLSRKDIMVIERLSICERLRTLILAGNSIKAIHNIDCCRQLWNLDISRNKVKSLFGLSRFPVLGSVCLGGNELDWKELHRISHMTILSLTLVGNPQLDADPNYRRHVVDMLPNVWMLDGRIVTAEEHKQVEDFFYESQASAHPVRRKASENIFVPTSLKNLLVEGVFGDKTAHMMSKFPISYIHNTEMDKKRLSYLIHSVGEDIEVAQCHLAGASSSANRESATCEEISCNILQTGSRHGPALQSLFDQREVEVEQCNMLLLLMLAALEYAIPPKVMQTTLEIAKLTSIGDVQCMDLFSLPRKTRLEIASLLLSAATVDRLDNKEGGLYNKLYKSLCFTMENVQRKTYASRKPMAPSKRSGDSNNPSVWRCLLASEVVHLMCLVPHFFEALQNSEGLMKMTVVATKNSSVSDVISSIVWKVQAKGGDVWEVYQEIASYLLQATSENVVGKRKRHSPIRTPVHRTTSQLLQSTQPKFSPRLLRAKSAGAVKRAALPRRLLRSAGISRGAKEPEMGDMVIMQGTEEMARIVAFPDPKTVVLQLNSYPAPSTSHPDAYFFMETNGLTWDRQLKCWTKDYLHADMSNSHLSDSASFSTIPMFESITSLNDYTASRAATPELGNHHARPHDYTTSRAAIPELVNYHIRPHSGMSLISDDLQTIPSEEELTDDRHIERPLSNPTSPRSAPLSPIKIDIESTGQSSSSITSESDHQKHVLQQYSLNQLQANDQATPTAQTTHQDKNTSPRSQALQNLQKSTRHAEKKGALDSENFSVPTPHFQLSDTWHSEKSIPKVSTSHYSKPHSCQATELNRLNHKVEPHMTPPVLWTSAQTLSQFHTTSSEDPDSPSFVSLTHDQPVLYNAWSVAMPNTTTKHSLLSSSRLMHKRQPKAPSTRLSNSLTSEHSGPGTYAVLRTRQQQTQPVQQKQTLHSLKTVGKYHYHHPQRSVESPSVRKLGKTYLTPDLFIGNKR